VNEEPPWESSINLMLTQHLCDEDLKLREVPPFLRLNPFKFGIISSLVILLQVDFISNDELKTFSKHFYETEDTSIFAWSLIFRIGHYHWLCSLIH
jgi:hypothetical protein